MKYSAAAAAASSLGCWVRGAGARQLLLIPPQDAVPRHRGVRWARAGGTCGLARPPCDVLGRAGGGEGSQWEVDLVWVRSVKPQLGIDSAAFLHSSWHGCSCAFL